MTISVLLLAIAIIVIGAYLSKPVGWAIVALGALAILLGFVANPRISF